ncbi:GNAT family N-acetyltransferase [Paraburkholderia sediminicola]|uniref:GNAT family N-acetyltransferase n=1 Tax=Paraburkholderia sediminicola TaxID=458836 RepID=UPI0038BCDE31
MPSHDPRSTICIALAAEGVATRIYEGLEAWLRASGAKWLRLGVIVGNNRAERFWERSGFLDVRRRRGVQMKDRVHSLRVMVKPLTGASLPEYLNVVPRDCPDSA